MKTVLSLIPDLERSQIQRAEILNDLKITGLALDSRKVKPGDLFLGYPGADLDGRHYIRQAIEKGAVAVFQEFDKGMDRLSWQDKVPIIGIKNLSQKISGIAAEFYQHPSKNMLVIAVTGTNGKTSITHLLAGAFSQLGKKSAVIGTMGSGIFGGIYDTEYKTTTPDPIKLQSILRHFHDEKVEIVAMEASSHALHQYRLSAVNVAVGVFSNLTRDHLDYHKNLAHYADAKRRLFEMPCVRQGVFNLDDKVGAEWMQRFRDRYSTCGYTIQGEKNDQKNWTVSAHAIQFLSSGFRCQVETPWGKGALESSLMGDFNVQNILSVLSVLGMQGYSLETILPALSALKPIPGRMQILGGKGSYPLIIIDFSHTPDALEKALRAARKHCLGKLICVFGCGGNRDRGKRPEMGKLAESLADQVIVTDDNVRKENPGQIVNDILAGCQNPDKMCVLHDRRAAIQQAIQQAASDDVIVLAGKGHETYQIIGDHYLPFNEEQIVLEILK